MFDVAQAVRFLTFKRKKGQVFFLTYIIKPFTEEAMD